MARMELKPRGAPEMLVAAARVSLASWKVFVALALIGAACQCAFERYAVLSGLTSSHLQLDVQAIAEGDQSLLSRLFPFSISYSEAGAEKPNPSVEDRKVTDNAEQTSQENMEIGTPKGNATFAASSLPRLRIDRVGNESGKENLEDEMLGTIGNSRFSRRALEKNAMPSVGVAAGVLLGLLMVIAATVLLVLYFVAFQHAAILGVICHSVVVSYISKPVKLWHIAKACFRPGMMHLVRLALLHGVFRGFLGLFFMELFLKVSKNAEALVVRLSTMPFSIMAPLKDKEIIDSGMSSQVLAFLIVDYVVEALVYMIYIVACWVTIMEAENRGVRSLQRSWGLVTSFPVQASMTKVIESLLCGRSFKWLLEKALGDYASLLVIAAAETYFTILWVVFYISARCRTESRFDHQSLEDFVARAR